MKLYNTLTRKVEEFKPYDEKEVKMYTCGPTVYHFAHIGNLRTYIFEDILEKTLNYVGYKVKRCMNITDVGHLESDADDGEDKMLKGAKREGKTVWEIRDFYEGEFFKDADKLNIKKPEIVSRATENIDEFIKLVKALEEKGYTYMANGNVYFDVSKFPNYAELSHKNLDDLNVAVRSDVSVDEGKKSPLDFVLWFTKSKFEKQAMKWDSPWGVGYPGWHIECSGISMKYLGEYLDIHCGGVDNIFPHHTNEIAQSESYLGHKWCTYWCHGEHLNDKSGKMSKSKGEFLTVSLLESKGYDPLAYRLFCLNSHYRNQLVFSYESLDSSKTTYEKLLAKVAEIQKSQNDSNEIDDEKIKLYDDKFIDAISNDLNTANALTVLFDVLKADDLNSNEKITLVNKFDSVLSLNLVREIKELIYDLDDNKKITFSDNSMTESEVRDIIGLANERIAAKKDKNFELADEIRSKIESTYSVVLKDTREGLLITK